MHRFLRFVFAACAVLGACAAVAHDYTLHDLHIEHPFARATPPGATSGGVYLTIENRGSTADRLVRVASAAAASVELHSMAMDGNVMRMRAIAGLDIAPGGKVTLGATGYHVMLVGLVRPLVAGDSIPVTLTFAKAGPIDVSAIVEAMTPGSAATHGTHAP